MSCHNLGANCPDDICRGTGICMDDGLPRAERCSVCGKVDLPELDIDCDCHRDMTLEEAAEHEEFWDTFYGDET